MLATWGKISILALFFILYPHLGLTAESIKRFTDNGNGTVTDEESGLMWTKDPNYLGTYCKDKKEDITCKSLINPKSPFLYFDKAQLAVSLLSFAGYDDWRLPTKTEAEVLLQIHQQKLEDPFGGMMPMYWTSTQEKGWHKHWMVLPGEGIFVPTHNNTLGFIWPVRDIKKFD